jgi:excisionase family DNA binding protein
MAKIVTAKELKRILKLTEATIYKLASSGQLPGFKIGDSWRFDMEEILNLIRGAKLGTKYKNEPR